MWTLTITTVRANGEESETELSFPSLIEFEEIELVSILDAVDNNLSAKYLRRLAWVAAKQRGETVPANIDEFGRSIKSVGYRINIVPFGETEPTHKSSGSSSKEFPGAK